jgi:hypothetical protein
MELAILGMLGVIGHELTRRPDRRQPPPVDLGPCHYRPDAYYPQQPGITYEQVVAREMGAMSDRMQDPRMVVLPFFGSDAKQHTSDSLKTRRLEAFTGVNELQASQSGTYQHKTEVPNMSNLEPRSEMVWGAPNIREDERLSHFTPSMYHSGVSADPSARMQVGPGLGLDPDTPAAGGFHPESVLRVMPNNVNEHRVNQFPSVVLDGKARIDAAQMPVENFEHRQPDRYWDQCQHPTMPTRYHTEAAEQRPWIEGTDPLRDDCSGAGEVGGGGLRGPHGSVAHPSAPTTMRDDQSCAPCTLMGQGGHVGSMQALGPYSGQDFNMPKSGDNREQCSPEGGPLRGMTGESQRLQDDVQCTQRGTCQQTMGSGPGTAHITAPTSLHTHDDYFDKGNRETSLRGPQTHGGLGLGPVHFQDEASNTQRGQSWGGLPGAAPAAPGRALGQAPQTFDLSGGRSHMEDWAPAGGAANPGTLRPDDPGLDRTAHGDVLRQGHVFQNGPGDVGLGNTQSSGKPVVENYHSPWGVLTPNDPNNPFVKDISVPGGFNRHG